MHPMRPSVQILHRISRRLPVMGVFRATSRPPRVCPSQHGAFLASMHIRHWSVDGWKRQVQATVTSTAATAVADAAPAVEPQLQGSNGTGTGPTFQQAVAKLQDYWASVGCLVWLPHNTEVGAGTMNPATFLRVLGPEPWNVCYTEPSVRPDDSRYGDNPNRVQRHTQFQVILKPDPGNSQELYLGSLEALGIDTRAHDVRFVEDNWESPVLGAWGLGWEVWLDGMEVTQFTYFQQAGGKPLDAPAVEITYGLERILMSLQGVKHFKDIRYNDQVTYGELFLQNEYEMSCYNLDVADIADQRARFDLFDKEARRLLHKRLPIPAYDHLLKLSHAFNILDARGAVGVTERADCFATLRTLAREVTGLWLQRREELGHPLGVIAPPAPPQAAAPARQSDLVTPRTLVVEVGTEELPPDDVDSALEQLREKVPKLLKAQGLAYSSIVVEGTPRRLAVIVEQLAATTESSVAKLRGPPAAKAFGADGTPSKALEGFCSRLGLPASAAVVEEDDKGVAYVFVEKQTGGDATVEVLSRELPGMLSSLSFRRSMRWRGPSAFPRPVRCLLALFGAEQLHFTFAGASAGSTTRVLRNANPPQIIVPRAEDYLSLLSDARISLMRDSRADHIWRGVCAAAARVGGQVPPAAAGDLLSEVAQLVESPTVVAGSFDPQFLQLPKEVLVMVMRKHQRYFPVEAPGGGALLPHFVTVANGPVDERAVAAGNEAVLRARFEDASFFYKEDLKTPLQDLRPRLSGTTFQKDLGSLLDKAQRTEQLVAPLAAAAGLSDAVEVAVRAAHLSRADLASSTVMEMTALAGTMGRHYALKQGLPEPVAEAIFESVLPRQAGDDLPRTPAGILVAVADRVDSLVGLMAAVGAPSATADPFGLRRSAVALLQTLTAGGVRLSLKVVIDAAAELQPISVSAQSRADVAEFITRRQEQILLDAGVPAEAVRAVLAERSDDPTLAASTAEALRAELAAGDASPLPAVLASMSRPTRIVRKNPPPPAAVVDPARFQQEEEKVLHAALLAARDSLPPGASVADFLAAAALLERPIADFFDRVFVMAEDEGVRSNRLALLRDLADLPRGVLDLTQLPGF